MYRIKEIQDKLLNVVGWEQSYNPAEAIAERLTETESGLYFQGAHPLVTLDNMAGNRPGQLGLSIPGLERYKGMESRNRGTIRQRCGGKPLYWVALVDNVAEVPAEGSTFWEKYNILSDYLERLTRNGISTAVQTFTQIRGWIRKQRTYWNGARSLTVRDVLERPNRTHINWLALK